MSLELWISCILNACGDDNPDSKPYEHAPHNNAENKILQMWVLIKWLTKSYEVKS